jgi:hypothetical protein
MATEPQNNGPTTDTTLMDLARLAPASIIRTETVLSKLPIHNLAKKGSIKIQIVRKGANGQVELSWRVSPSRDYGEPRQLAYKIDTLIVNRRIDEEGRPLPPMIALGSIRQICRDLGINEGKGSNDVKRAILQNSSAFISAKLTYKGNDGVVRKLDTNFARYSVIFTGEKLPDGRSADGVYLIPTEPYREVLNNARVRPLNYDYLRKLPPTQQRFYEIVSYQIFATLKHRQDEAKMTYSEYCTYSAQERHLDRARVQKQMYKVHRPHLASGYLKSVRYQETSDSEGKPDWLIYYVPGPKARAEYHTFSNAGRLPETVIEAGSAPEGNSRPKMGLAKRRSVGPRQKSLRFETSTEEEAQCAGEPVLAELMRRGIGEGKARELLTGADPKIIFDQLEWGDHQIRAADGGIRNPPGFYIHLIEQKITPPEDFETSRRRQARQAAVAAESIVQRDRFEAEEAYHSYRADAVKDHIATCLQPEDMERFINLHIDRRRKEPWAKNLPPQTIREIAERDVHREIAENLSLLSFDAFREQRGKKTPASEA